MQIKCWRVMTKISNFFEVATTHVKPQLSLVKRYCEHNHTSSANWDEKLRRHPSTVTRQASSPIVNGKSPVNRHTSSANIRRIVNVVLVDASESGVDSSQGWCDLTELPRYLLKKFVFTVKYQNLTGKSAKAEKER